MRRRRPRRWRRWAYCREAEVADGTKEALNKVTPKEKKRQMRSDGDGAQSRDMCYVDNVVDVCVKAAKCQGIMGGNRTMNNEILHCLLQRYPSVTKVDVPWRSGDVMHTQADISKAERVLGYVPLVRFWDGLDRTIEWYATSSGRSCRT